MPNDPSANGSHAEVADGASDVRKVYDQMEHLESARQALLARKPFSVKTQVVIAHALIFILVLGVAWSLIANIYRIQSRLQFLEFVNDFSIEIQQARRYEKNFFLYGTNLDDGLENIHLAKSIFAGNADQFASLLGSAHQVKVLGKLDAYEDLLLKLKEIQRSDSDKLQDESFRGQVENQLRRYGKDMITTAQGLMGKEKVTLARTLRHSLTIHMVSLVVLLVVLVINAYLLVSRIVTMLTRFSSYARRIASGDFTPVTPSRRYRDEFTELALAINEMIKQIANREAALVQIHKIRAIGTLTAGVAHELNNPMNNILLTAHMLIEDNSNLSESARLEMLQDVVNETGRAKNIVGNLLDFARESASTIETLNLDKLLQNTIRLAENQVRMSGIKVELQVTENLPSIHGDGQKLQQVFLNLILNAVDASSRGGKIQVIAMPDEQSDHVAVKVLDYGKGIPKHLLSSIFDPFFTTKAKGKGTGLGLSVSQGIVAKHGGKITVSSEEGSGTVFSVVLPVTTFPKNMNLF
jgi:signal transduction histidine kinase